MNLGNNLKYRVVNDFWKKIPAKIDTGVTYYAVSQVRRGIYFQIGAFVHAGVTLHIIDATK